MQYQLLLILQKKSLILLKQQETSELISNHEYIFKTATNIGSSLTKILEVTVSSVSPSDRLGCLPGYLSIKLNHFFLFLHHVLTKA